MVGVHPPEILIQKKLELQRKNWTLTVHSDAIRSDVLEVGTAEKLLKFRTLIASCILTVFETIIWEVELLRKF